MNKVSKTLLLALSLSLAACGGSPDAKTPAEATEDERRALMAYCATDVDALEALLPAMLPGINIDRALWRGRVMAALGHGGLKIGTTGGGVGGPSVGYVTIIPLMIASLAGGYLYTWNPASPWLCAAIAMALASILIALFVRDPKHAER